MLFQCSYNFYGIASLNFIYFYFYQEWDWRIKNLNPTITWCIIQFMLDWTVLSMIASGHVHWKSRLALMIIKYLPQLIVNSMLLPKNIHTVWVLSMHLIKCSTMNLSIGNILHQSVSSSIIFQLIKLSIVSIVNISYFFMCFNHQNQRNRLVGYHSCSIETQIL